MSRVGKLVAIVRENWITIGQVVQDDEHVSVDGRESIKPDGTSYSKSPLGCTLQKREFDLLVAESKIVFIT